MRKQKTSVQLKIEALRPPPVGAAQKAVHFAESAAAPKLPPRALRVAMLIVHGMGQQVPYQTISQVTQSILTCHAHIAAGAEAKASQTVRVRLAKLSNRSRDAPLPRAEFTMHGRRGERETHVYEAYWAPLTEGQIGFWEVVKFLFSASGRGVIDWWKAPHRWRAPTFTRWMFGESKNLPIKGLTAFWLIAAAALLLALLTPQLWIPRLYHAFGGERLVFEFLQNHPRLIDLMLLVSGAGVFLFAALFRSILIQYVGDVAIYVSSHALNRWSEVRENIKTLSLCTAKQIYGAKDPQSGEPFYDRVIIVGHSLGSVVAYDTLNAAINWDEIEKGGKINVLGRTSSLITFGSPLDKTAYLFRAQVPEALPVREALAAQKQPLILDYARYRPKTFRWMNLWSCQDVISGPLAYYDDPKCAPRRVVNVRDKESNTLFQAHVQYWNNPRLRRLLHHAIIR